MSRPVIPVTSIFASDVNYTTGPVLLIGTATKIARAVSKYDEGYVGDEVPPAQEFNDLFNAMSTWVKWVGEGDNTAAETDHIVETDVNGEAKLARLDVQGHSVAGPSLNVVGSASGVAADIDNTNGNFTVSITNNGALAGLRSTHTGTGTAIEGIALGTNNDGVKGNGIGTGTGVVGNGGATGSGGIFTGGASAGHGLIGIGAAVASAGVRGQAQAGASSWAIEGIATHISQTTIIGRTFGGADSTAIAVHGAAGSDATGVKGSSTNGYGVVAESDTTTPARAAFRLVPQDTDPTTPLDGDIYFKTAENRLRFRADGNWREVWSSRNGYTHGHGADSVGGRNSVAFNTELTCTLAAPDEPSKTGIVIIKVSGRFRNQTGALSTIQIRVRDVTAGPLNIGTDVEVFMALTNAAVTVSSANAYEKTIAFTKQYALPAAGARTFDLQVATLVAGGVEWADLNMEIDGIY